jgi:sugar phosphate isomerase/epimerase
MLNRDELSLCCGTLANVDFRTLVESAAGAGFQSVSMWPTIYYPAIEAGLSEQDMRLLLDDNGLTISEIDPICNWFPAEHSEANLAMPFFKYTDDDFFRISDALGGKTLNAIQAWGPALEQQLLVDALSKLCERAATHDLAVSVEFLPWSPIANLSVARELVEATGQQNCGVNLDTWHHYRSGGSVEDILGTPGKLINAIQLNDIDAEPWPDIIDETSNGRLLPGEGVGDSEGVIDALDVIGCEATLGVEIFSSELNEIPPEQAARRVYQSTRQVLKQN